jgi:hypothetical protein
LWTTVYWRIATRLEKQKDGTFKDGIPKFCKRIIKKVYQIKICALIKSKHKNDDQIVIKTIHIDNFSAFFLL